jgi:UDP-4-amino-4-deoxy-L-arabinose-oxoglutarate aminotransferase
MEMLGWKCNMSNIQAALLIDQIDRLEEYWQRREAITRRYEEAFEGIVDYPKVLPNSKHARHLFTIWVEPERRDEILGKLQDKGIGVAVNYRAIHLLSYYRQTFDYQRGMFPIAEKIGDSTISLPLYPKLTDEEVEYVIKVVKEVIG